MTTYNIDLTKKGVRARIPAGTTISGNAAFSSGVLFEGDFTGGMLQVDGNLIVSKESKIEGFVDVSGDAYILGEVNAQKMLVGGKIFFAASSNVSGYVIGSEFDMHAGCTVKAALSKHE